MIDGSIVDWAAVNPYPMDAIGDGSSGAARPLNIDILQGAVAHDANFIYVLWRNAGENMVDAFSNWVFFDMDRNPATGGTSAAPSQNPISIGYEFNLGGTVGWNAFSPTGDFAGGAAGKTHAVGNAVGPTGDDFIEWRISRTEAQPNGLTFNAVNGSQFNFMFVVEDSVGDFSPENPGQDWFTYDIVPEPTTGCLAGAALCAGGIRRRRL